jgi:hypothetical protein
MGVKVVATVQTEGKGVVVPADRTEEEGNTVAAGGVGEYRRGWLVVVRSPTRRRSWPELQGVVDVRWPAQGGTRKPVKVAMWWLAAQ